MSEAKSRIDRLVSQPCGIHHVIGAGIDVGIVTVSTYVETGRKHPGVLFTFCPMCGLRIFVDDIADEYERRHGV